MSFSTLSFSPPEGRGNQHGLCHALSIKQHPSILCLQCPSPPPHQPRPPLPRPCFAKSTMPSFANAF